MNDWVVMECGCKSNPKTNEVQISVLCQKRIDHVWHEVVKGVLDGRPDDQLSGR